MSLWWGQDEPRLPATPNAAGHLFRAAVAAVAVSVVNRAHYENGASTAAGWADAAVLWVHLDEIDQPGYVPEVVIPDPLGRYCLGDRATWVASPAAADNPHLPALPAGNA